MRLFQTIAAIAPTMKLILYTTVDKLHTLGKQNCKQASINLNEFALFLSLLHHIGKAWLNTIWPTLDNTALCRLCNGNA